MAGFIPISAHTLWLGRRPAVGSLTPFLRVAIDLQGGTEIEITLWEGNLNTVFAERRINSKIDVTDHAQTLFDITNDGAHFKIERAITEADKQNVGIRQARVTLDNFIMVVHDFQQGSLDPGGIAAIGNTNRYLDASPLAAQCPIGHLAGDEVRVRYDDLGPVKRLYSSCTDADALDIALGGTDNLSLIHISEPTRPELVSRIPSSA